jgi:hypothetical protein
MLLLLLLLSIAMAETSCLRFCETEEIGCAAACNALLSNPNNTAAEPFLRLQRIAQLADSEQLTGADVRAGGELFITSRRGALYSLWVSTGRLSTVFRLPPTVHELYGVAFNTTPGSYRFYLYYSTDVLPAESTDPLRNHDSVVVEYALQSRFPQYVRELRRLPQYSARSQGWIYASRDSFSQWLYFSAGGNLEELRSRAANSPELSTVYGLSPNGRGRIWASGIANPLSCTMSSLHMRSIYCLVEDAAGRRHLYALQPNYNYGSDEFLAACQGLECEQLTPALRGRSPLLSFPRSDCPVESIHHYSGSALAPYRSQLFLSRAACYRRDNGLFQPAQVLRLYRDHSAAQYKTVVMPLDVNLPLVNTVLLGADGFGPLLLSGHTLRAPSAVLIYNISLP